MLFNIKNRLKLVADYITGRRLADIGSDHAYLPIYLAKKNKINFAIAGEIVDGPYKSSLKNVLDNNLDSIIFCKKGAGLEVISLEDNIDTITICGMGGKLISEILELGKNKLKNKPRLILQPNVASNLVREQLEKLQYKIINEDIIEEDGHIYEIIVAESGSMKLSSEQKIFGIFLPKQKNEVFIKKWKMEYDKTNYIISQMKKSKNINQEKLKELEIFKEKICSIV